MKELTIDELKALKVGDWVWVVDMETPLYMGYYKIHGFAKTHIHLCVGNLNPPEKYVMPYALYGTKWLAYKNKEIYEECKNNGKIY